MQQLMIVLGLFEEALAMLVKKQDQLEWVYYCNLRSELISSSFLTCDVRPLSGAVQA